MQPSKRIGLLVLLFLLVVPTVYAQDEAITLTLAAYTVPREAYAEIIPLFQAYWREQTGQEVTFQESYLGSGAQSRAVAGGFEADIVALSLENDVTRLVDAGVITHDWKDNDYGGMVHASVAVVLTRPDSAFEISDWDGLTQPDLEVLTPDPATSGGAMWNIMALYGAAHRGFVEGYAASEEGAAQFLADVFANVGVLDPGARESFLTFESGVGDAIITYENEYYAAVQAGGEYTIIYPRSTILIENPVALVDTYVEAHGTREAAQAFIEFLYTPEAQRIFALKGFRPVNAEVAQEEATAALFPEVEDLFTIADFGGWEGVVPSIFGDEGVFTRMITELRGS